MPYPLVVPTAAGDSEEVDMLQCYNSPEEMIGCMTVRAITHRRRRRRRRRPPSP